MSFRAHLRRLWSRIARGKSSGLPLSTDPYSGIEYSWSSQPAETATSLVAALVATSSPPDPARIAAWQSVQTIDRIAVRQLGYPPDGHAEDLAPWFFIVDDLPDCSPALIEQALLVAACEEIDAVSLADSVVAGESDDTSCVLHLYRRGSWRPSGNRGAVSATVPDPVRKRLLSPGTESDADESPAETVRRGPYRRTTPVAGPWRIGIRDPGLPGSAPCKGGPPRVLVTAPFLARGGAEQTLYETARWLAGRGEFDFSFATLAPHRPELGDRRADFASISPHLYSLGDILHPDAMYGALVNLIDRLDIELLYNSNGTTLFYDFARRLRNDRPRLAIADHLYDHRVGYIERYGQDLTGLVDLCVAENHAIAGRLRELGWSDGRTPVVWPCGRRRAEIPEAGAAKQARERLRRELGIPHDALLVLTAARVHPQKRPFDWLALAERCRDLPVEFLWVGGGDLEAEMDRRVSELAPVRARRLPFRQEIPELLAAADAACLVSEYEGLPVFLLEALQSGRPFFATDAGDIPRLVDETNAGIVAGPAGDLAGLERAVHTLLDPRAREQLAGAARSAAGLFDVAACAGRYSEVFRSALDMR